MEDPVEIAHYVARLAEGDEDAAQVIWDQYFDKLVRQARKRLECLPRRVADEEDVALSAMESFYRCAAAGRFPRLQGRDNLWRLLLTITARKVHRAAQRHFAQREGGGCVLGESAIGKGGGGFESENGIAGVAGKEPAPDLAAVFAENCRQLLEALPNDESAR